MKIRSKLENRKKKKTTSRRHPSGKSIHTDYDFSYSSWTFSCQETLWQVKCRNFWTSRYPILKRQMHFLLHVVIYKQHLHSTSRIGIWKQREPLRREASPAARGPDFRWHFWLVGVVIQEQYISLHTAQSGYIGLHSPLSLPLPTGISRWSCEHADVCFHVLQAYKNNKAYV